MNPSAFDRNGRQRSASPRVWILCLLCCALLAVSCSRTDRRPNVLLVTLDTTRADHLGAYGDAKAMTPHFDGLAREGVLLEQAITPVPVTLPSHTTMMTGLYPPRHGVKNNGSYFVAPSLETLAEHFQAAGYRTGAFVSAFVLDRQFGLAQGFEAYDDSLFNERPGASTAARALSWLRRKDPRPFFCWVHLYDAHTPWTPPARFADASLPSAYDQEIAAADDALGALLDDLRARKLLDRSVIAVLADHGEGLSDHGEAEHGVFLYNEVVHIPWVFRLPRAEHAGRRVADLVATVDLAPTLVELTGLPPLTVTDGLSLTPSFAGQPLPDRHGVYLETIYPQENFGWAPLTAFLSPEWKWIRAPRPELYDMEADRAERDNRATDLPDTSALLDRRLERLMQAQKPLGIEKPSGVSPEVEERLRSLGYLSGGELTQDAGAARPDPKDMIPFHGDFETAKNAMDANRFADAIEPFQRVLAREDGNLVALLGYGLATGKVADFAESERALRRAAQLSPGNLTAIGGLADAAFGQRKYADALELYRLASPDRSQARHVLARSVACLLGLGRDADADAMLAAAPASGTVDPRFVADFQNRVANYRRAKAASDQGDQAVLNLVRGAAGVGLSPEAERLLERELKDPAAESTRLELAATFFAETGRPGRALTLLEKRLAQSAATPALLLQQGLLELEVGNAGAALAAWHSLDGSSGLAPAQRATLEYGRARAEARSSRRDLAMAALRRAAHAGFDRVGQMVNEPDLLPLRGRADFQALVDSLGIKSIRGAAKPGPR